MAYEVVYFDGEGDIPAYFLIGAVEGDSPEQALADNIDSLTVQVINELEMEDEAATRRRIRETLYVLRSDALVSFRAIA